MIDLNNLFVVIDPSTDKQYALQRAMRIAKVVDAKIHAHLCISPTLENHDLETLERVEIARYTPWLEALVAPVRAEGFDIATDIVWNPDWRHALGEAARRVDSDLILKSSHRRSAARKLMMTSSDIALLQTATCPVQLVSTEATDYLHRVLLAVDAKREDDEYREILKSKVEWAKAVVASHEKGELHVVCAYSGSENFRYVTDIAKRLGIDTGHIHEVEGKPDEAIVEVAKDINAEMIVIGLSTRATLKNRIFGHMVDRLLNNIDHDILVVVPEGR